MDSIRFFSRHVGSIERTAGKSDTCNRVATIRTSMRIGLSALVLFFVSVGCAVGQPPIVFTSDRDGNLEIYMIDPSGEMETKLTNSPEPDTLPRLSPNKQRIAFRSGPDGSSHIDVINIKDEVRTRITPEKGSHPDYRWGPQSDQILYVADAGEGGSLYVSSLTDSETSLLTSLSVSGIGGWFKDGDSVVFVVSDGTDSDGIWIRNPEGVNEFQVTHSPDQSPVWSPNTRRISFISVRDGNPEIYVMNTDGTEQMRLTESEASEYDLSWSPDGRRLMFVSTRDGNPEIYTMKSDGEDVKRLTINNVVDEQPVWSPDSRRIAFVSHLDGDAEIFVMNADGNNQRRLTNNDAEDTSPSW